MADDELYKPMTRLEHILVDGGEVEPVTRFEKIMAGQSVDGMTRNEYFWKKKIDIGGGGYSAYDLLEGAPEQIIDTAGDVKVVKSYAFADGNILVKTYSDQGFLIRKVGTEEVYEEAGDLGVEEDGAYKPKFFSYEETDQKPKEERQTEESL
jgi:hypothetical protein